MTTKTCLVVATPIVNEKDLHAYDIGVPGVYLVSGIDPSQSDDVVCETALESFHNREAIKVLEDFSIRVIDADTRVELNPSSHIMDSVEVVDCSKLSDEIPEWIVSLLHTPSPLPVANLRHNTYDPY